MGLGSLHCWLGTLGLGQHPRLVMQGMGACKGLVRCGPEVSDADGMMHTSKEHHWGWALRVPGMIKALSASSTAGRRQMQSARHRLGEPPGLHPSQHSEAQRSTAGLQDHMSGAWNLTPGVNPVIILCIAQIMLHCIWACAKGSL